MASQHVHNVTDATFAKEVLQADKPTLVDFWATWCQPCLAIAPHVEAIATAFAAQLKVCKLDIDNNPQTPTEYNIRSIPTLLMFYKGQVIGQQVGSVPRAKLEQFVQEAMARATV